MIISSFLFIATAGKGDQVVARWLASPHTADGEKLAYEMFILKYTPIWIGVFAIIIIGQLYEEFDAVRRET